MGNAKLAFMKLKLLFVFLVLFISAKSQTSEIDLKDFINKNHLALRSVHKYMIHQGNSNYEATFRDLLKKQENAVKTANDKATSLSYAYAVRTECLNFLKQNSKGSLEYFELTTNEQKTASHLTTQALSLSQQDLKTIDNLNLKDSQSLNLLSLTIQ